ncbi:hypothetical protein [Mycoplasma feriruminatoris]|uniref:Uncharacterized protein n=2 Tax=Mycoplasma feriruminatoris TaxID=1179777 RepID=A0AAQ3DMF5_9MOLU|nr:hypothetical protein [Mycoplasma feriruminatoris]UKS54271.1 putative membrane protein [Mycoplasma feriruminatoris]WFQ90324.1 hypothetical protein MFERI11561_00578 [Mycoplasma feriruminatoris]WFQ91148.1 hypothetical protein MFERI13461_00585 [Mycoplasma feriruminatoris]WFQ91970.1 hypothetical protein MFERI14815_00586 [Mycoplasma feriruminatoris]WFQ92810.1 hypothetical protein MFERI14822_00602 [Mycoplasma feriruminatoris]
MNQKTNTLVLVGAILSIIGIIVVFPILIIYVWFLFYLTIPATIATFILSILCLVPSLRNNKGLVIATGIFALFWAGLIPGILLLVGAAKN